MSCQSLIMVSMPLEDSCVVSCRIVTCMLQFCKKWTIEYFEQQDTTQPAEVVEDILDDTHPKLSGKLLKVAKTLQFYGHQLGGGYIEKCHDYEGMWEIRVIHSRMLAREFFGFDKERIVLLHGYTKRT